MIDFILDNVPMLRFEIVCDHYYSANGNTTLKYNGP